MLASRGSTDGWNCLLNQNTRIGEQYVDMISCATQNPQKSAQWLTLQRITLYGGIYRTLECLVWGWEQQMKGESKKRFRFYYHFCFRCGMEWQFHSISSNKIKQLRRSARQFRQCAPFLRRNSLRLSAFADISQKILKIVHGIRGRMQMNMGFRWRIAIYVPDVDWAVGVWRLSLSGHWLNAGKRPDGLKEEYITYTWPSPPITSQRLYPDSLWVVKLDCPQRRPVFPPPLPRPVRPQRIEY